MGAAVVLGENRDAVMLADSSSTWRHTATRRGAHRRPRGSPTANWPTTSPDRSTNSARGAGWCCIETRNDLATLVNYLGALAGGHVVLPLPAGGDHTPMLDTYDPDVVVRDGVIEHRHRPAHDLHPDLALLLSTSGSTGSPKLVRLSRTNLATNAEAIANTSTSADTDRAATTLPMSYCYGLSVMHSHLLRGAALILTDHSVVDDEFWESVPTHRGNHVRRRATHVRPARPHRLRDDVAAASALRHPGRRPAAPPSGSAGSPRSGSGGVGNCSSCTAPPRRPPEWPICQPNSPRQPDLRSARPIPGGSFDHRAGRRHARRRRRRTRLPRPQRDDGLRARDPPTSRSGRTVDALRTGDIARRHPNGLYEVVGRSSRFVKMYGLRIDLQRVEDALRDRGVTAICTDGDGLLLVAATERPDGRATSQRVAADAAGLPRRRCASSTSPRSRRCRRESPTTTRVRDAGRATADRRSTTLDLRDAVRRRAADRPGDHRPRRELRRPRRQFAVLRDDVGAPGARARSPARRLAAAAAARAASPRPGAPRRWWGATLETSVALRAVAIVLVVGSHAELFTLWGGAHILLGIAGYNFGRFCLTPLPRADRVRHLRNTIGVDRGAVGAVGGDRAGDHRRLHARRTCCWPTSSSVRATA